MEFHVMRQKVGVDCGHLVAKSVSRTRSKPRMAFSFGVMVYALPGLRVALPLGSFGLAAAAGGKTFGKSEYSAFSQGLECSRLSNAINAVLIEC